MYSKLQYSLIAEITEMAQPVPMINLPHTESLYIIS